MKNLDVEVARSGRKEPGAWLGRWKVLTGAIVVSRFRRAKDARRFAKNLRKLYAKNPAEQAGMAALLALGQMQDDHDSWDMEDRWEHEEEFEPAAR